MYRAIVYWWDDNDEEDRKNYVFLCANSFNEAIDKLKAEFNNIDRIDIELIVDYECNVVYVPEECFARVRQANCF